ncbi:MAG: hypothetical protein JWP26_3784 [Devosia sp.]|nr:hypothetical protein [Devosia sp.]
MGGILHELDFARPGATLAESSPHPNPPLKGEGTRSGFSIGYAKLIPNASVYFAQPANVNTSPGSASLNSRR